MQSKQHWEQVYTSKTIDSVSWYQPHAELSLRLIDSIGLSSSASIIDVGGGASTLTDDLLERGYSNVTVLDLSGAALAATKARLGERSKQVTWMEADVTRAQLPREAFDLWHDRAVFHFLTEAGDRAAYLRNVYHSVRAGGHAIVATFAEDGPTRCSGLPVMRYSADELYAAFGENYRRLACEKESHRTPGGAEQRFTWCCFLKLSPTESPAP